MIIAVFLITLLGAIVAGVPIAFSLLLCGLAMMIYLDEFSEQIIADSIVGGADSFSLMAIPFFIAAELGRT